MTDADNDSDADEIEDDYYADEDIDANMPEADQDVARSTTSKNEDDR